MKSLLAEDGFLSPLGVNYSCEGILQCSRGQTGRPAAASSSPCLLKTFILLPSKGLGPEFLGGGTCSFLYCFFTFNQAPGKIGP